MRWWPPYLGAGIRVDHVDPSMNTIKVSMRLDRRNRNYVGTHFGGNLYSMCDPWYMFILLERLGSDFIVWDKAASIEFLRPGRGTVFATFQIDDETIDEIRVAATTAQRVLPKFETYVIDGEGQKVAKVLKTLYVRKKSP